MLYFRLLGIFTLIKSVLLKYKKDNNKKEEIEVCPINEDVCKFSMLKLVDYSKFGKLEITKGQTGKTLLIVDDIPEAVLIYKTYFRRILRKYNNSVERDFTIVEATGYDAGYKAYRYIVIDNEKVDYAILDITLGHIVRLEKGEYVEIDGIDLAILLLEKNPDIKFVFLTSHTLNRKNISIEYYFNKFETTTGKKIEDYYLNRNSVTVEGLYEFLYGESK